MSAAKNFVTEQPHFFSHFLSSPMNDSFQFNRIGRRTALPVTPFYHDGPRSLIPAQEGATPAARSHSPRAAAPHAGFRSLRPPRPSRRVRSRRAGPSPQDES